MSTEFTTLIGFFVGQYASRYGLPAKFLNNEVFPDPAAPHTKVKKTLREDFPLFLSDLRGFVTCTALVVESPG